jgi:hypothetical protein
MNRKTLWRGVLAVVLSVALTTPVMADTNLKTQSDNIVIGVVVAIVGVVVLAVVLIHYSKERSITGCVVAGGSGMSLADEKDKQTYALSGDTTGVKAGDRMKLRGKLVKSKGSEQTLTWKTTTVAKDFGICQP